MKSHESIRRLPIALVLALVASYSDGVVAQSSAERGGRAASGNGALSERSSRAASRTENAPRSDEESVANAERADALTPQEREVLGWANEFARDVTGAIEKWLASGRVSEEKLFSHLYYPIADSEPTKFNTDYDALSDNDFPAIQEKYFSKAPTVIYAIAMDSNGYVPTHNRQFSQPTTGNLALDLVNSRTKRIFSDATGFAAARNLTPNLVQSYKRDTGEAVADLSVPVNIRGKHWGCVRIGFRKVNNK